MTQLRARFLLFSLLLCRPPGMEGQVTDHVLPFMEHLDGAGQVTLKWGFSNVFQNITFQLSVNTTGWVGFGLSPKGNMIGADIVIGGVESNGTYFKDHHGIGTFLPPVDEEQSYTLLSLTELDGQTSMTFSRSFQTCDKDDFPIPASSIKLIYAYGTTDEIKYHSSRRGTKELNLLRPTPRTSSPLDNYLSLTVENVTVPPVQTYYHCKVMKTPNINGKHHIYRIEPNIENLDLVHHILLYRCPSTMNQTSEGPCYSGDGFEECFSMIHGWAVGGGPFEFPENAGMSIGGQKDSHFYRIEIHYNNPTKAAGRRDNSGMRLYYTSQLREHDVGLLTTGLLVAPTEGYVIPPNATDFQTYGLCHTSDFSKLLDGPAPDLNVFSIMLHTHLAGRKIRVGHFRDGKQVDFLGMDENYNFDYQEVYNLGEIKTIKPGDEILVECTYNTENRTGPTWGGLGTTNEMCLAFLFYYPAIDISNCWSHPNMRYLAATKNETLQQLVVDLSTKHWTKEAINEHEALMKTIPQYEVLNDIYNNYTFIDVVIVRDMMETATESCNRDLVTTSPTASNIPPYTTHFNVSNLNMSHRERGSWVMTSIGCLFLLLCTRL
ncbi:DBH-like monooxygenase protein 2 homolog [Hypomesus transpacificus]|uniref:DBH-like monooxygenase protein 2 homolog n=1 Tax=Hypomesus transpacificus TaxID=137520 RepID=UPI001F076AE6|nr:DBH-like monooxygenase protein 2 homolog [Hypomesus transpacificus]